MASACFITGLFVLLILFSTFLSNKAYKNGMKVRKVLLIQVISFLVSLFTCSTLAFATTANSGNESCKETYKVESSISSDAEDGKGAITKAKTLAENSGSGSITSSKEFSKGLGFIAMALCIFGGCIGAGIAVAAAAPAAIGAVSEDKKSFGTCLVFVALSEGVSVFGLLIAIFVQNAINNG